MEVRIQKKNGPGFAASFWILDSDFWIPSPALRCPAHPRGGAAGSLDRGFDLVVD